jgi:hypothetical protein
LSQGALRPLLNLLGDSRKLSMLRNATWTLSNFCRGKTPQPDWNTVRRQPSSPTPLRYHVMLICPRFSPRFRSSLSSCILWMTRS